MKIYTRGGDRGATSLADGSRVPKSTLRVSAYGNVDELNAAIGVLRAERLGTRVDRELAVVQSALFEIGAWLADPCGRFTLSPAVLDPIWLEDWIDAMDAKLEPLKSFVLPDGGRPGALAHLARTVCRRAERQVVALATGGIDASAVLPFLNRLSDALFVLARWLNRRAGKAEGVWRGRN
jgi:cob(I)alamin adenosyltransferase